MLIADSSQLEELRLVKQTKLDLERSSQERNKWGQFATPPSLAQDITNYAVNLHPNSPIDFLEPACGSGVFFSALVNATRSLTVRSALGVELDSRFAAVADELWSGLGFKIINGDYFSSRRIQQGKASLVVANPPYTRHHHLSGKQKIYLAERSLQEVGIRTSRLSGLYVYFILLTHRMLAKGAVSAWIIPSTFLNVNYGSALREYLSSQVTLVRVHLFDSRDVQFDDALVTSCVVIYVNLPPQQGHSFTVTSGGTFGAPRDTRLVGLTELSASDRWIPKFSEISPVYEQNSRIGDFFNVRRGIATGNNSFFILPSEKIDHLGISWNNLQPILPSPRYVKHNVITGDSRGHPLVERQMALINSTATIETLEETDPPLFQYLTHVDSKTANSYLVKKRRPWYKQETRAPAPFLVTYMGSDDFSPIRIILNRSMAITTNSYLMMYPKGALLDALLSGAVSLEQVHSSLLAITPTQIRNGGRVYGGGLWKLEPREMESLDASLVTRLLSG